MDPRSAYGLGKKTAEHICALYASQFGLHLTIARCFAFVGPYLPLDIHYAIGNFIHDGLNKRSITIRGNGTPYRSYLYAADLVIWLWTILLWGTSLRPYNVVSDDDLTIEQVARQVSEHFEPSPALKILGARVDDEPPARYVPSIMRARRELGLEAWIPLHEAISRTINYYRGQ